jgi:branched-chain amino acid transport system substrate-binding protein
MKLGLSVPLSGAGSTWGLGMKWSAQEAAKEINAKGGIKVAGKTYTLEVVAYDNKYNTVEGTKAAQALFDRDGVTFVVGAMGTGPTAALQSIGERRGAVIFTTAWGRDIKGPKHPTTFTEADTTAETLPYLYDYIKKAHPNAKTVALINPNDATGSAVEEDAKLYWTKAGFNVILSDRFERDTPSFQSLATKVVQAKPDIVDMASGPPDTAGLVFKELRTQDWHGVQVIGAGGSAAALVKSGGEAAEGTYMGLVANFSSSAATPLQRRLDAAASKDLGEPLNPVTICTWDAVMALKAALEKAQSLDPNKVSDALRNVVFESSYGPGAFGGADIYGISQQILIPVSIAQIKDGTIAELARITPEELKSRLAAEKK